MSVVSKLLPGVESHVSPWGAKVAMQLLCCPGRRVCFSAYFMQCWPPGLWDPDHIFHIPWGLGNPVGDPRTPTSPEASAARGKWKNSPITQGSSRILGVALLPSSSPHPLNVYRLVLFRVLGSTALWIILSIWAVGRLISYIMKIH